jgi:YHS domain-containing protein
MVALVPGLMAADKKQAPKPYPMETCAVSGEKLGGMGEAFVFEHEGREVKLCCKSCKKDFDKDAAKFTAKIDEAAKKVKTYPAKTCLLSGEPLDDSSPGSVYKGQEFKFCCKNCQAKFDKEPTKYADKLPRTKS